MAHPGRFRIAWGLVKYVFLLSPISLHEQQKSNGAGEGPRAFEGGSSTMRATNTFCRPAYNKCPGLVSNLEPPGSGGTCKLGCFGRAVCLQKRCCMEGDVTMTTVCNTSCQSSTGEVSPLNLTDTELRTAKPNFHFWTHLCASFVGAKMAGLRMRQSESYFTLIEVHTLRSET